MTDAQWRLLELAAFAVLYVYASAIGAKVAALERRADHFQRWLQELHDREGKR